MDELIKLVLDIQGAKDADEAAAKVEKLKDRLEKLDAAQQKQAKSSGSSAQSLLQLGRGIQDFQAAGLAGIVNNFEGLALALGLGSGVAGVATIAAVALQTLAKPLREFLDGLTGGDEKTRDAAAAIDSMREAGEKLKKTLAELKGAHDGRAASLAKENDQLERAVAIEKQREANRKRPAAEATAKAVAAEKLLGEPTLDERLKAPSEKARADEIRKAMGGPEAAIVKERIRGAMLSGLDRDAHTRGAAEAGLEAELADAKRVGSYERMNRAQGALHRLDLARRRGESTDRAIASMSPAARDLTRRVQKPHLDAARADMEREAEDMFGRFQAGDADALSGVIALLQGEGGAAGEGPLRQRLERLTPGAQARQRLRDVGGTLRRFGGRVRDKAFGVVHERNADLTAALNQQGLENERAGREALAEDRARDVAAATGKLGHAVDRAVATHEQSGDRFSRYVEEHGAAMDKARRRSEMGERAAAQYQARTGMAVDPRMAAKAVEHQQQQLMQAQQEYVQAMMGMASGLQQQAMMFRGAAQDTRRRRPTAANEGTP